jgi:hypothetical protein
MSAARRAWCQEGKVTATGPAPWDVMSTEVPLPVTVSHLPAAGCRICHRTAACRTATPFFENSRMKKYAVAPRLATAEIPSAEAFAADSGHWNIAVSALIRAVVLDRVPVTDPLVTKVIGLLGPAVDAEVQYAASGGRGSQPIGGLEGGFPEHDAPVFLLGACCLVDATWAVVGLDPLRDVLDYLGPRLDAALAELNCTLKPSSKVLAQTLLRAAADFYRLGEEPADAETMRQLGGKSEGNPLDCLISEKVIEPADALTIGLAVLATLADLCRTARASVRVPC